jgi:6-phosphogluconolactonase
MPSPILHIEQDVTALLDTLAKRLTALVGEAVRENRLFYLALSGGHTPRGLYRLLATPERASRLPWNQCDIWFGDERCVPPWHPDSNYRMARESLFDPLGLAAEHIHRMQGEAADPREAARAYAAELRTLPRGTGGWPRFDLILLGIGPDGHLASLFPGSENLAALDRPVAAAHISEQHGWRISLTLPVIRAARRVLVLAAGAAKAEILSQVLAQDPSARDRHLPAMMIRDLPQVEWYLDRAAGARL